MRKFIAVIGLTLFGLAALAQPLVQGFFTTNSSAYLQAWVSNWAVASVAAQNSYQAANANLTNFSQPALSALSTNNAVSVTNIQTAGIANGTTTIWTNRTTFVTNTISVNGGVVTNVNKLPN